MQNTNNALDLQLIKSVPGRRRLSCWPKFTTIRPGDSSKVSSCSPWPDPMDQPCCLSTLCCVLLQTNATIPGSFQRPW